MTAGAALPLTLNMTSTVGASDALTATMLPATIQPKSSQTLALFSTEKLSQMKPIEPTKYVEPNAEDVRLLRIWRIDYDSVCFGLYTYTPAQFHAVHSTAWDFYQRKPTMKHTTAPGTEYVEFYHEYVCVYESRMPAFMECVRANGLHGKYHEAGHPEKEYKF